MYVCQSDSEQFVKIFLFSSPSCFAIIYEYSRSSFRRLPMVNALTGFKKIQLSKLASVLYSHRTWHMASHPIITSLCYCYAHVCMYVWVVWVLFPLAPNLVTQHDPISLSNNGFSHLLLISHSL